MRDRDRFEKKPGAKRVLVIGDSYTWGYAVADDEAFPQTAERLFRERGYSDIEGNYLHGFAEESLKWRDSKQAIREMRDMCVAARVPFTVLTLPDFTQTFDDQYAWRPIHEAVASWGREMGFPVFDLLGTFRGENHAALCVPWDGHPNAEAHGRIAEFLVATILADARFVTRSLSEK